MSAAERASLPGRPIRLLLVDHTAGVLPFQRKFDALARRPDVALTVFGPDRWVENFRMVRARSEARPRYRLEAGRVVWPGYENRGFYVSRIGPVVRRARPDLIHMFEEPFSLMAWQALRARDRHAPGVPALFFSSDDLSYDFRYPYRPAWFYARVERWVHRRVAGGTVVNDEVVAVLRSKGFAKPLERIPHGLDLAPYEAPRDRHPFRRELGIRPDGIIIGFVGRLLPMKGVDLLLRAAATLRDGEGTVPPVMIVGHGPEEAPLRALAGSLGLGDRVRFLPAVPHEDVPALLRGMDVLVVPSRRVPTWQEQFGRVLIEGMAAGCAVIGSTCGAIPRVLGDAGLVFPENDAEGLAAALRRTLDPAVRADLVARGRARVAAEYTWDAIAGKLVDFYERILSLEAERSR